jgi:hypothetical protein
MRDHQLDRQGHQGGHRPEDNPQEGHPPEVNPQEDHQEEGNPQEGRQEGPRPGGNPQDNQPRWRHKEGDSWGNPPNSLMGT